MSSDLQALKKWVNDSLPTSEQCRLTSHLKRWCEINSGSDHIVGLTQMHDCLFEEFGEVYDCYLPEDPETGGSRGFGFVTLDKDAAEAAIRATNGCELDGRIIRVNAAQPKGSFQNTSEEEGDDDWSDPDDGF